MGRALLLIMVLLALGPASAGAARPDDGAGLTATIGEREVDLAFAPLHKDAVLLRDGAPLATLPRGASSYEDRGVAPGGSYTYAIGTHTAGVALPAYLVGAATADITPDGAVNLGGFGLGDGTVIPDAIVGRGGYGAAKNERNPPPAGGLRRRPPPLPRPPP